MTAETPQRGDIARGGRRTEDLTLFDIWRMLKRARWMLVLATGVGSGAGWIGGQALGPTVQRVIEVSGRVSLVDSLHSLQFSALRAADARLNERVDDLAAATKLNNYLICTVTRRSDPAAVPPECNQVILDWRRSGR
jgi:hypothetical protein